MKIPSEKNTAAPLLCIGMPVYNGAASIGAALASLKNQSFTDFQVVISDNASTDATEAICRAYAAEDARIIYVRQPSNIGAAANFKFVLDQARSRYFHWMGADDMRSPGFMQDNVGFLDQNTDYVASTGRDRFAGGLEQDDATFEIVGSPYQRAVSFLHNAPRSHGIFYSVVRTDILQACDLVGRSFWASDWAIDLFMASHGPIHRALSCWSEFGKAGASSRRDAYKVFRGHPLEAVLPYYSLSLYVWSLCGDFTAAEKAGIAAKLALLNTRGAYDIAYGTLYYHYSKVLRPIVRGR